MKQDHRERDAFGCPLANLADDAALLGADIRFYRKRAVHPPEGLVATPGTARGTLIGLSVKPGHYRRIHHAHHASQHDFGENGVYIRRFSDPYKAELSGSFDFILMEISPAGLERIADGADCAALAALADVTGEDDPVLGGLARALFASAGGGAVPSPLFVEQMAAAIGTHLVTRYGDRRRGTPRGRRLSTRQAAEVQDMLRARLAGDVCIDTLAAACKLSRSTFLRAFRETTGRTPHNFLIEQRIDKARDLLLNSAASLSEIARDCGFSDQAHFSRVFAARLGAPPSVWRRNRLA
ncbi:AraC family transcriptional regulator [Xaviernesmea oryzae]|uniref:AraC family transcriptional regulator n=1 Tax=Xaviernesmea oryzae TaxID=464029 RepID=A0A1Q9B3C0_9HYPH|nr:AraC family transcriptional regulator [Xaviernesmea oryzae]OLP62541.1 AraC family transcriptional regulator [Xaviernesmea oryzae]SEM20101.1 Helix-turn-helix domain-containing protein [Xaviernesmea oryzae]